MERYYVCGPSGNVRIFDRKHQKYISGISFQTNEEAEDFLFSLYAPQAFTEFLKAKGPPKKHG